MTHTMHGCRICRRVIVGVALVLTFAVCVWWAHGEEITPACALNPDLCESLTADEVIKITAGEIRWQGNNPAITGDRLFAWTGDPRITCMTTGALPGPLVPCGIQDRSLPENAGLYDAVLRGEKRWDGEKWVNAATSCDLAEFRAASKAWADLSGPEPCHPFYHGACVPYGLAIADLRTPAQRLRAQADNMEEKARIEARWRQAVRACAP